MGTYPFKLPDIGEGVVEAEITVWHVALGDVVEEDQPIADAMTDKATIELTAPVAGRVSMVACEEGEMLAVGATLVEFETEGEDAQSSPGSVPGPLGAGAGLLDAESTDSGPGTSPGTYHFKLPDIGEGVVEAEITEWHVAVGDAVEEDQPIADAMTDKATIDLTSPVEGVVRRVACEQGELLAVGATLVEFAVESGHQDISPLPEGEGAQRAGEGNTEAISESRSATAVSPSSAPPGHLLPRGEG